MEMDVFVQFSFSSTCLQTLKNYKFPLKVTKPFSPHILSSPLRTHLPLCPPLSSLPGCNAGPSFPLIKYVCLYMLFGILSALHSRSVTYGKHCLLHNTVLSWSDFFVQCITQISWRWRWITCCWAQSFIAEIERGLPLLFSTLHLHRLPWLCLFNPPCALSRDP